MASRGRWGGVEVSGGSTNSSPFTFLFVVNKLEVQMETRDCLPEPDRWGNVIPPTRPGQYTGEIPSSVMRYDRGRVTEAHEYYWTRLGGPRTQGRICPLQGTLTPTPYKEQTVFSCNPFLPIVVANGDTSLLDDDAGGGDPGGPQWNLLHFRHDWSARPGVSLATCSRSNRLCVAGRDPSWIPHLVPQGFANPDSHQSSRGLGGDLPLLLALMAFSEPGHLHDRPEVDQGVRMSRTFYGDDAHWRDNYWTWNRPPQGYSSCDHTPTGFFVHVCLDDVVNPMGSTYGRMEEFESSPVVRENR